MISPLVSCIMPTRNRRRFVPLAVRCFLRQAYGPRELIVVDDGDDPVADLLPRDERIRYVRLDRRHTVGAKRNVACRLAQGDIIVHWDDDDWMADWRLTYQVGQLLEKNADLCGLDRLLFLDARQGEAWQYVYPRSGKPWLAGGTLCYRRELWQRNHFPDLDVGEDNHFVWSGAARRLLALPDNTFYVATIHDGNTSPKRTHGIRWQRHPVEPLRKMLGSEWEAYAGGGTERSRDRGAEGQRVGRSEERDARGNGHRAPVIGHELSGVGHRSAIIGDQLPNHQFTNHQSSSLPITVSLPYFNCRRYLLRAVDSILGQTHTNLTLVVVNDGDPKPPWDLLAHIDDPRLVRYDLGANRGRYFVDAVILAATPDSYLLIQDADDWSEPGRVTALLNALGAQGWQLSESCQPSIVGAVSACRLWREGSRASQRLDYPGLRRPLSERFEFRSDHHGLFRTDALRAVGGNYGGYRIGYDTLLVNLLSMLGEVAYVEQPLYHRQVRANSLTTSQATGMRSAHRRQVRNELASLYAEALRAYHRYRPAGDTESLAAAVRAICQARVSDAERAEIAEHAARLREFIAASQQQWASRAAPQSQIPAIAASDVEGSLRQWLSSPELPWNGWSVTPAMASRLAGRLAEQRPQRVLEAGSGVSTALLARYAALTGAEVVTLEHDPRFLRQTATLLERLALHRAVDLRLVALKPLGGHGGGQARWYKPLPAGQFDMVFVDGPPQQVGRGGTLAAVAGQLSAEGELWLHNGHRQHEQECLRAWRETFQFDATLVEADKGAWILRNVQSLAG